MKRLMQACYLLLFFYMAACSDPTVGSKNRPFTMYFVPAIDARTISVTTDKVVDYVAKYVSQALYNKPTGFYVKGSIPSSYIAIVEAFGTQRADFAIFNTFGYILAKDVKKYPVEAILTVEREKGKRSYHSQILVRADSNIKTLQDLNGKRFAFSDPASTSGYIVPHNMLTKAGVKLKSHVFAQKHDNVVAMIYQKQVDAGATFYDNPIVKTINGKKVRVLRDARARVLTQFPDVEKKIKILKISQGIPNEPWMIRSNLYKDKEKNKKVKKLVKQALLEFQKSKEGYKALKALYDMNRLVEVKDSVYDDIRKMILSTKLDLEGTLKKKDKKIKKK
ncbi:MAG: phosphate/phosphite/phosphonate ABC transporter substrate-binding protein [Bdellovibrionaceae bacterium]|nr:phosphate/phosphite/phosphonate ABC transporter substrate-binding protein [Pseudobdellovibrionaceae bacterium]